MTVSDERWPAFMAVREWLEAAGFPIPDQPTVDVAPNAREMACALIEEEVGEFRAAVEASDLVGIADAVADIIWVTLEAAATFGIPVDRSHRRLRRSEESDGTTMPS
jgi:phosphoribosyl-ATP pyrophosphohydrolase